MTTDRHDRETLPASFSSAHDGRPFRHEFEHDIWRDEYRHLPTFHQRPDQVHEPLYVLTTIFNSPGYRSRWRLAEDFIRMVEARPKCRLFIAEIAFGEREFAFTKWGHPRHLQLRSFHELWYKEHALNLLAQRLPPTAKYIAWMDADTTPARPDWDDETIRQLQHHPVVQMWSQMHDLTPDHELVGSVESFANVWVNGGAKKRVVSTHRYPYPYPYMGMAKGYPGAPGLMWATWRSVWDRLGGLLDQCILGAGDWYMAHALTGQVERVIRPEFHPRYKAGMLEWQRRAQTGIWHERPIAGNIGVVKGVALHYWHGPKVFRRYATRDQILVKGRYNPDLDLKRDSQGLYNLTQRSPELRRAVKQYFHERQEDSITP